MAQVRYIRISGLNPGHDFYMTDEELAAFVKNGNAILNNKKELAGLNGAIVKRYDDGVYVIQLGGYDGRRGMYNYLVELDDTLTRTV